MKRSKPLRLSRTSVRHSSSDIPRAVGVSHRRAAEQAASRSLTLCSSSEALLRTSANDFSTTNLSNVALLENCEVNPTLAWFLDRCSFDKALSTLLLAEKAVELFEISHIGPEALPTSWLYRSTDIQANNEGE